MEHTSVLFRNRKSRARQTAYTHQKQRHTKLARQNVRPYPKTDDQKPCTHTTYLQDKCSACRAGKGTQFTRLSFKAWSFSSISHFSSSVSMPFFRESFIFFSKSLIAFFFSFSESCFVTSILLPAPS